MGKRSEIMLAYPFEERRLTDPKFLWKFPVIVQPKLDGERCRVTLEAGKITLRSSECNEIISVPHINEFLQKVPDLSQLPELDGELYLPGMDFSEIHSVVSRRENIHEQSEFMQLHIFDFVSPAAQLARTYQLASYSWLDQGPVKRVSFDIAYSMQEIMSFYECYLTDGYEGIIIRHLKAPYVRKRSRFMLKFKKKKDDYYRIVGFKEEISKQGSPKNALGALVCCGDDGNFFNVGTGFTREDRIKYWKEKENLIGQTCHVAYQNITSGRGVPRFSVFLSIIKDNPEGEIECSGIL